MIWRSSEGAWLTGTLLDDGVGMVDRVGNLPTHGHCVEMVLGESGFGGRRVDPCMTGLACTLTLSRPVNGPVF